MGKNILIMFVTMVIVTIFVTISASAACPTLYNIQEIQFNPVLLDGEVDLWGGSILVDDCGALTNVTISWYANASLIQQGSYTNVGNNSGLVDVLEADLYHQEDTVTIEMLATSSNGDTFQQNGSVTECVNGFDDDGDGDIDFIQLEEGIDPDSSCVATYDDTEDVSEGIACTATGGGSVIFLQQTPDTSGEEVFVGPEGDEITRNDYLDALKDLTTTEIPCNNIDDNNNGLIDENCQERNFTITTDTGADRFVLYVPPGGIRDDRGVKITNFGRDSLDISLSCEGPRACEYITFEKRRTKVIPSPDLPEEVDIIIDVPITEMKDNIYRMKLIATDAQSGQRSNILLELHINNRLAALSVFDNALGQPLCRNVGVNNTRPVCTNYYQLIMLGLLLTTLVIMVVLLIRRRRKNA